MITITTKQKTLVTLPTNLLVKGKRVARSHDVSFSEYVAQLLSADMAGRRTHSSPTGPQQAERDRNP